MLLDRAVIDRAYLVRAAALHPDLDTAGDAEGESTAQHQMALLNRARALLADPESRAEALLAVLGGPSKESDTSLPLGFLMEFMEIRQEIEAAVHTDDVESKARWHQWIVSERARYQAEVTQEFERDHLPAVRTLLNAWRYIERAAESLKLPTTGGA